MPTLRMDALAIQYGRSPATRLTELRGNFDRLGGHLRCTRVALHGRFLDFPPEFGCLTGNHSASTY